MMASSPTVRWIAAESRDAASQRCPLGFVVTGTSVVDRNTGKLVWESVQVVPTMSNPGARQSEEEIQMRREERGIGQADVVTSTVAATPTGVMIVGGVMVLAVLGYAAYEYALKDWLEEDDEKDEKEAKVDA